MSCSKALAGSNTLFPFSKSKRSREAAEKA
jgi:hypothetical protein